MNTDHNIRVFFLSVSLPFLPLTFLHVSVPK
jgi:hypothetical protein